MDMVFHEKGIENREVVRRACTLCNAKTFWALIRELNYHFGTRWYRTNSGRVHPHRLVPKLFRVLHLINVRAEARDE
jgi:hypothetical protein